MNYTRLRAVNSFSRPLEKSYFPNGLKRDPNISPTAKMVAALLGDVRDSFAEERLVRTRYVDDPPTHDALAGWLGVSRRSVLYAVDELKRAQYLVVKRRRQGRPFYLFRAPQMPLAFGNQDVQPVAHLKANQDVQPVAHLKNQDVQPVAHPPVRATFTSSLYKDDDESKGGLAMLPSPSSSSSSFLIQNGLTDEQAATIVALRSADEIREQVEALPYRRPKKPAATLFAALRSAWSLPEEYLKARGRAAAQKAQMELRAVDDLDRARIAAAPPAIAVAELTGDERRERLPDSAFKRALLARRA